MKTLLTILFIVTFAFSSDCKAETITILNLTDTHSNLSPGGPRDNELNGQTGGIARAASVIGMTRQQDEKAILLHAGDIFIGDLFFNKYFGVPELSLLKHLGCDALALGNHEFDLTPEILKISLDSSFKNGGFPVLCANFQTYDNPDLYELKEYISHYSIITRYNTKIGVFGMTTPETNFFSNPAPVFIDTLLPEIAYQMVAELQNEGCDIIIMLSHLGRGLDQLIATNLPGIDFIIGGHDHEPKNEVEIYQNPASENVYYMQSGPFYRSIGKTVIEVEEGQITSLDYQLIKLDNSIPEEPTIKGIVNELIAGIEETYGPLFTQQIAEASDDFKEMCIPTFEGIEYLDTPVGNLVTDAFLAYGQTDIAIEPGGSTSQQLYKGPLTGDDIFRMIGYGFNMYNGLGYRMATFELTGENLLFGLEYGLSSIESNDEMLLQVGGMSYNCNLANPPFSRLVSVMINGEPIDPEKTYSVTSNEFVIMFLDLLGLPYTNAIINEELTEFEVVMGYVTTLGEITPTTGRIMTPVQEKYNYQTVQEICLAPNPCKEETQLSLSVESSGLYNYKIYSLAGNCVGTWDTYLNEGVNTIKIDTHNLLPGAYCLRIEGKKLLVSQIFIVSD